jgi:hypothetical protein
MPIYVLAVKPSVFDYFISSWALNKYAGIYNLLKTNLGN